MVSKPCSLQNSLDYDITMFGDISMLSEAHQFAIKTLQTKCISKLLPSSKDEIAAADKAALQAWREAQGDNRKECHPIRHHYDDKLRAALDYIMHTADFSIGGVYRYADIGPGASVGRYAYEGASFASKFDGEITYTNPDLVRVFGLACNTDTRWRALFNEAAVSERFVKVKGGSGTFVPKTAKISRMVVTPPLLNGFTDRGVGEQLSLALRDVGINLSTQPDVNREMARIGSISGAFATIDLEGASSRLDYNKLKSLLPPSLQWWLRLTRPDSVEIANQWEELTEIQTMGSGITFPLQTAIFLGITKVSYDILGIEWRSSGSARNVSVFGDDMIVDTRAFSLVCDMLRIYGLKINMDKTFNTGCFRESCGADWYSGLNVRAVYVKDTRSLQDRYTLINLLNEWSLRLGLPSLNNLIFSILGRDIVDRDLVPQFSAEYSGIRVPLALTSRSRARMYHEYTCFIAQPTSITISSDLVTPGLWLGVLRGEVTSSSKTHHYRIPETRKVVSYPIVKSDNYVVNIRVDKPRYSRIALTTSSWDENPFEGSMPENELFNSLNPRLLAARRLIQGLGRWTRHSQVGLGRIWIVNPEARAWKTLLSVLP